MVINLICDCEAGKTRLRVKIEDDKSLVIECLKCGAMQRYNPLDDQEF